MLQCQLLLWIEYIYALHISLFQYLQYEDWRLKRITENNSRQIMYVFPVNNLSCSYGAHGTY